MSEIYYIPSIEDFHVGFEYELSIDNEWHNCGYHPIDMAEAERFLSQLNDGLIRVKYLDKEDIESLKYVQTKFDGVLNFNKDSIGICWMENCPSNITITDTNLNGNVPTKILFNGIIRNISELKVLLKQLGI